jgi:Methyl-accepting chemotaxis protein
VRRFVSSIPVRFRIGLAVLLPLLVLIALCLYQVDVRLREVRAVDRLSELVELAPSVSGLIHELQKERGMSAGFTGSKGAKFADSLPVQRRQTDEALTAAEAALAEATAEGDQSGLAEVAAKAKTALAGLADVRARVSRLELSVKELAGYYTATIADLLAIVEQLGVSSVDARLTRAIVAYMALLRSKEAAGLERAMGSAGFGAGAFEHGVYLRFLTMIARQETYLDTFKRYASEADRQFLASTVTGPAVDEVERMQRIGVDSVRTGSTEGIQAEDWFRNITAKIDLLRNVEEHQTARLRGLAGEIRADVNAQYRALLTGSIVVAVLTIAFAVAMARSVTRPMAGIVGAMRRLTDGDTTAEVTGVERRDEIGAIARALQIFRDGALEKQRLEAERHAAEARGLAERKAAVMGMANRIESETKEAVQHVQDEANGMAGVSQELSRLTEATGSNAAGVAAAAEEMLRIAETVAAAAEELAASSDDIRGRANSVGEISDSAANEARRATGTIDSLLEAAASIGGVLNLIKEIAEKTHLLALNATIEAARAGDAGRGFAVVAAEVKMLANQTAKATDQISEQVAGIHAVSAQSSAAINEVARVIQQVEQIAAEVVAAVEQQREATQEISGNMHQNAQSSREVTERIADVSSAARASNELAERVRSASQNLQESVDQLQSKINQIVRSTDDANRRTLQRKAMDGEANVVCRGESRSARIKDISVGGACVIVDGTFAPGEIVALRIVGENQAIGARVVEYRTNARSLHLRFDDPRPEYADQDTGAASGQAPQVSMAA